jgi:hypothetical protein
MSDTNKINGITSINSDIDKLFKSIEDTSQSYIDEISSMTSNNILKYKYMASINILFLFIIGIIFYILYRDYIYRIASKMTRCADINNIIDFNINDNDNSYIYNIYIVHISNTNNITKDYILKLEYNFIKEETNIFLGEQNIISSLLFSPNDTITKISNAFAVFDLAEKKKKFVEYYNRENEKTYCIDKKKLATIKYKYYITSSNNEKLVDESAVKLVNFVKKYGYNDNTKLDPIYNILYAIENKKNMEY